MDIQLCITEEELEEFPEIVEPSEGQLESSWHNRQSLQLVKG